MRQAVHILAKDVRRLWLQITALMLAIVCFAAFDFSGNGDPTNIEFVVGAAVWFLIARAVHEESLPGENQFWLTRPYGRGSLLLSKVLLAIFLVGVPFFLADCAILAMQAFPVGANLGGLVLRQLVTGAWLILPPLVIASITRTITEDVMVWLVALGIAGLAYFPGTSIPDFRASNEKYELVIGLALLLVVLCRQYFRRGATVSRALFAVAVLLPILPFPEPAALAIEGLGNDPAASGITVSASGESVVEQVTTPANDVHCALVMISFAGLRPDWRIEVLSQQDSFEAGGRSASMGWRPRGYKKSGQSGGVESGTINVCLTTQKLLELGAAGAVQVHARIALAVFQADKPSSVTAGLEPFDIPGVGRCHVQYSSAADKYALACKAPVWFPRAGRVVVGSVDSWSSEISFFHYPWAPLDLLPGMSPVYRWTTLPLDNQIRDAISVGGQIEFRPETRIAVLQRDVYVSDARLLAGQ
jgi:hypothetical protein